MESTKQKSSDSKFFKYVSSYQFTENISIFLSTEKILDPYQERRCQQRVTWTMHLLKVKQKK